MTTVYCPLERVAPRHARTLACREEMPPEALERRHQSLAAVRTWALAACGGCPHTRDLLLDLVSGRITMTEAAAAAGQTVSTVSRTVSACLGRIRWASRLAGVAGRSVERGTGFTLDPVTAELVGPRRVWAVSLAHLGMRLPHRPSRDDLMRFLSARALIFRLRRGRQRYFGGWVEEVTQAFCLDVTVLVPERETAIAFARKNRQRCITSLATGEEILLPTRPQRFVA